MFKRFLVSYLFTVAILMISLWLAGNVEAVESTDVEQSFITGGVAWIPDGEILAVGANDGIWLHTTDDLTVIDHLAEQESVTTLDWSPDGNGIVAGTFSGVIQVWEVETNQSVLRLDGHSHAITSVKWSPDGNFIASGSWDDTIRVWDTETGEPQQVINLDSGITIDYLINWSADSRYIAFQQTGPFTIWDIANEEVYFSWPNDIETPAFTWSPDGDLLATSTLDGSINLWDASTGELMRTIEDDLSFVSELTWGPNSRWLAAHNSGLGVNNGKLQVWDITTGDLVTEFPDVIIAGVGFYTNAMAWSPDGSRLAANSDNGRVYIWDMETYETLAVYEGYESILRSG